MGSSRSRRPPDPSALPQGSGARADGRPADGRPADSGVGARFQALVHNSRDVFAALAPDLTINWISPSVEDLLGFPAADLVGVNLSDLLTPDSRPGLEGLLGQTGGPLDRASLELELRTQTRRTKLVEATLSRTDQQTTPAAGPTAPGQLGDVSTVSAPMADAFAITLTDVTDRRAMEASLRKQALFDPLTGLANRTTLHYELDQRLQRLTTGQHVGLLHIDIDDFRAVNTSIGFERGDDLLAQVAARLRSGLGEGDVLARMGGNEFAIVVTGTDPGGTIEAAHRTAALFDQPFEIAERSQRLRISMGVDVTADRRAVARDLIDQAALALGAAKGNPQEPIRVYQPVMRVTATERFELGADLNGAAERGELHLVYQPIVELATGGTRSVEALLRWIHPLRGPVSPGVFIPLAEKSPMILDIGRWVMAGACRQIREWQDTTPGTSELSVGVNVSVRQLEVAGEAERLVGIVVGSGLEPHRVTVELTESTLLEDPDHIHAQLQVFRGEGMAVAVDDFGTGAAGLGHLRDVPFDAIKIDKSYVDALSRSGEAKLLIQGVIELAHNLGAVTVAEGVEGGAELDVLSSLGCDMVQGFYLGRPMEPAQFPQWLAARPAPVGPAPVRSREPRSRPNSGRVRPGA